MFHQEHAPLRYGPGLLSFPGRVLPLSLGSRLSSCAKCSDTHTLLAPDKEYGDSTGVGRGGGRTRGVFLPSLLACVHAREGTQARPQNRNNLKDELNECETAEANCLLARPAQLRKSCYRACLLCSCTRGTTHSYTSDTTRALP